MRADGSGVFVKFARIGTAQGKQVDDLKARKAAADGALVAAGDSRVIAHFIGGAGVEHEKALRCSFWLTPSFLQAVAVGYAARKYRATRTQRIGFGEQLGHRRTA